jgi:hypothetical protein
MPAELSPGRASGESTVHPAAETRVRKDGEDGLMAYSSDPHELFPRWLREMQQKSDKTSFNGNALVLQNSGNAEGGSTSAARSTALVAAPKSEIPQSETPGAATDSGPVVAQSETPASVPAKASGETINGADEDLAATAAVSPTFAPAGTGVAEAAETEKERTQRTHEDVALVKAPELDEQLEAQPNKTDLASQSKPNKAVVSEIAGNALAVGTETKVQDPEPAPSSARLSDNLQSNSETPEAANTPAETRAAGTAETAREQTHEDVALVKAPGLDKQLEPQPNKTDLASQSKPNEPLVSENAGNARAVVSETKKQDSKPAPFSARWSADLQSNAETPEAANTPEEAHVAGIAQTARERTHEDVALVKAPGLDKQLEPQPNKTDLASQSKPNKPLVSENAGNARAVVSETKEQLPKPAAASARLIASPESNAVLPAAAEERSKPRGYITVESKPEAPRNPGAENLHPKPQEHSLRAQEHLLVRDRPAPVQEYPSKAPDSPSEPKEKSGDLRNFASAFLQTDQNGNIAEQHRFYADSVHFYGEGDLSWAGVEAATRRHRQERQNKRYGTEGTAAVKGPVDGGFYVVEQPVSWTRAEGSRLVRGRSVLRLRVVPTNRGNWKITSIDEVRQ